MQVSLAIRTIAQSEVILRGTVTSAATGAGLSRRLIVYDKHRRVIAEGLSNQDGSAVFQIAGNSNDVFVVHAVGEAGECDAISCPIVSA